MNEFIIVFRETLEAALIVGVVYTLLLKNKWFHAINKLWLGVGASIAASFGIGMLVIQLKSILGNNASQALFEGLFLYITAGFIYYVVFWLSQHVSDRKQLEEKAAQSIEISAWGIFFLIFFAILREGFETVIFLVSSVSMQGSFSYFGFILGAVLAIGIGVLIVAKGQQIELRKLFQMTTLGLVIIASGMIAYGTHEMEEYFVKSGRIDKTEISRPWSILEPKSDLKDTDWAFLYSYNDKKNLYIHFLHDKGSLGVFLKGFIGYNSNPNVIELFAWVVSIVFGLRVWKNAYSKS